MLDTHVSSLNFNFQHLIFCIGYFSLSQSNTIPLEYLLSSLKSDITPFYKMIYFYYTIHGSGNLCWRCNQLKYQMTLYSKNSNWICKIHLCTLLFDKNLEIWSEPTLLIFSWPISAKKCPDFSFISFLCPFCSLFLLVDSPLWYCTKMCMASNWIWLLSCKYSI